MKAILEELNMGLSGIIGSFVIDEEGVVAAQDVPELIEGQLKQVSKTLSHANKVIKATRSLDKMTVDSENASLISIPVEGKILVVIVDKNINQPLFKLMSNMAISKIRQAPVLLPPAHAPPSIQATRSSESGALIAVLDESVLQGSQVTFTLTDRYGRVIDMRKSSPMNNLSPGDVIEFNIVNTVKQKTNMASYKVKEVATFDFTGICILYDQLFGIAAKRVENLIGPKGGERFKEDALGVIRDYPEVFSGISFNKDGKPDLARIMESASKVYSKDELVHALDEMLLSMFNTVKKIAGQKQELKARKTLDELLDSMKQSVGAKQELKAIDTIQKIKIKHAGII